MLCRCLKTIPRQVHPRHKVKVLLRHIHHRRVNFNQVLGHLRVGFRQYAWDGPATQPDHQQLLRVGLHQQPSKDHADIGEDHPLWIFQVDAGLVAFLAPD